VSPGPADGGPADGGWEHGPADSGFAGGGFAGGPADGGFAAPPTSLLAQAQDRFWQAVHAYAAPRYPIEPVIAVDKLTALYRAAITLSGAERVPMADNLIARIRVDALTEALLDFRCPGGCFVEVHSPTLDGLKPIALRKVQTISYLGLQPESIRRFVWEHGLRGVDRIVPIGKTMDFSLTWDGYDLIQTLSRSLQAI
jgi:hypothetical protein